MVAFTKVTSLGLESSAFYAENIRTMLLFILLKIDTLEPSGHYSGILPLFTFGNPGPGGHHCPGH